VKDWQKNSCSVENERVVGLVEEDKKEREEGWGSCCSLVPDSRAQIVEWGMESWAICH